MHVPKKPLPIAELTRKLAERGNAADMLKLFGARMVDEKGRYLHWDEFRRKVTEDNLSPEEGWFATRTARLAAAQFVPLLDVAGRRFSYCEPPCLRAALQFADLHGGGVLTDGEQGLSPTDGGRYFRRSLAEEPFASSFIEGAATTRQRAKQLIFDNRSPRSRDERMVLNNYQGLEYIKGMLSRPLSVDMILETHRIITEGTLNNPEDAGKLRQSNDILVVDDTTNEILHEPPNFNDLPTRLQALCNFANDPDQPGAFVHPIIRAIILHFALAYEHPFVDGNGRTARALFYWSALKSGYWLIEYVSISSVIAEAKKKYGQAFLKTETDENDLTYFLLHQADVLKTAIERLLAYAERKRQEVSAFQKRVLDDEAEFNKRQSSLLNDAVRNRVVFTTIAEHEKLHKVSRLTARSDLEELVRMGLFKKKMQGRTNHYIPATDISARLASRR